MAEDEAEDVSPSTPNSNAKRKPSANNTPRTPKTPNGPRTPAARKASAQKTPASAPARQRTASKKQEPTLLGDFLLGRPSTARQKAARRKSLDVVKAEMRAEVVGRIQQPGKVQQRVKQWQKTNAKVGVVNDQVEEIIVEYETESEVEERARTPKRPGRRKSRSLSPAANVSGRKKDESRQASEEKERPRSKSSAPKKRVISDSHWMKNKKSPPRKGQTIPKNFLQATAINPPVERKIEDWVKRMESEHEEIPEKIETPKRKSRRDVIEVEMEPEERTSAPRQKSRKSEAEEQEEKLTPKRRPRKSDTDESEEKSRSRKVSKQNPPDDGIRIRPLPTPSADDGIRIKPLRGKSSDGGSRVASSRSNVYDDGIRVTPSKVSSTEDGIRIKPSPEPYDDGIRIRPSREPSIQSEKPARQAQKEASKRRPRDDGESPTPTPRKKSEKYLKPPSELESRSRATSYETTIHHEEEEDDKFSWVTPSPPENSKRRNRKSATPTESLDEIPFGNSAFSVLDLPVGAEANTIERPKAKRNNSFGVPKVLKRVYNVGKEMVHDTVEPQRGGPNQPPSIENWLNGTLNGTTDPFVDGPSPAQSTVEAPQAPVSRMRSYKEDDRTEKDLTADRNVTPRRKRQASKTTETDDHESSPMEPIKNRDTLPSMENSSPTSPVGLRRSPATRNVTTPKSGRKLPFKDAIFGAFKGESAMAKTSTLTPFDMIGLGERGLNREISQEYSPGQDLEDIMEDPSVISSSPPQSVRPSFEVPKQSRPVHPYPRRLAPTTGGNRLSTIASVETFHTSSSATSSSVSSITESGSELSHTTITQDTVLSGATSSGLSRGSKRSTSNRSNKSGLKRTLTKHSDFVSMLSLPDAARPARGKSIRSNRSVRTSKTHLRTDTVEDLLQDLAEDQVKYWRELNTLVDGVIPVLLTCVLSRSDSALAAGLLDPLAYSSTAPNASPTQPIVDMGVALERLRSLHKRIGLADTDQFLTWASTACKIYEDYLKAWRTGFQDVVVNLAPASRTSSLTDTSDQLETNEAGEVIGDSKVPISVGHLLKMPLHQIKAITKVVDALHSAKLSEKTTQLKQKFDDLVEFRRKRVREETSRAEDHKANSLDTTQTRDLKSFAIAKGVTIKRSRQVVMKDIFQLHMLHSTGQAFDCAVEVTLRDARENNDPGDVLISEIRPDGRQFLLFDSMERNLVSARVGETSTQLVVMVRGNGWKELLHLTSDETDVIQEWLEALGTQPVPPPTIPRDHEVDSILASIHATHTEPEMAPNITDDIPIGESLRREAEELGGSPANGKNTLEKLSSAAKSRRDDPRKDDRPTPMTQALKAEGLSLDGLEEDKLVYDLNTVSKAMVDSGYKPLYARLPKELFRKEKPSNGAQDETSSTISDVKDLNEAMAKAGAKSRPSRYHGRTVQQWDPWYEHLPPEMDYEMRESLNGSEWCTNITPELEHGQKLNPRYCMMSGGRGDPNEIALASTSNSRESSHGADGKDRGAGVVNSKLRSPERKSSSIETQNEADDTNESHSSSSTQVRSDGAPPPPVHRTPTPTNALKLTPIIESPTPRARRRTSSPLKHEYQPSDISAEEETASESDSTDSDYISPSDSESDEMDELAASEAGGYLDIPTVPPPPMPYIPARSPPPSTYSPPQTNIAPSDSASQAGGTHQSRSPSIQVGVRTTQPIADRRFFALVFIWNKSKGRWEGVDDKAMAVVVGAGCIHAYRHDGKRPLTSFSSLVENEDDRPFVAQPLTPIVSTRKSNAVDIEINAPLLEESIAPTGATKQHSAPLQSMRFRMQTASDNVKMYEAVLISKQHNVRYNKQYEEAMYNQYGQHSQNAYDKATKGSRAFGIFRRKSFRVQERAPASEQEGQSMQSGNDSSILKRMSGGGIFNIAKSTILRGGSGSGPSSLYSSRNSGTSSPHSVAASGSMYSNGVEVRDLGHRNIKIRLHYFDNGAGGWDDRGDARLTVTDTKGMKQECTLDYGPQKRIRVTRKPIKKSEGTDPVVILDVVLGAQCFSRLGRTGVIATVWNDVVDENGEVGKMRHLGGVAAYTRKWCFKTERAGDCEWIYALCRSGDSF